MALDGSALPNPLVTGFVANYDPIRGGTSYFDVAPGTSSAVPEPKTWVSWPLHSPSWLLWRRRRAARG